MTERKYSVIVVDQENNSVSAETVTCQWDEGESPWTAGEAMGKILVEAFGITTKEIEDRTEG